MWDSTALHRPGFGRDTRKHRDLRYPTSRKKRARCGAPQAPWKGQVRQPYNEAVRRRNALAITETELKLIAAAAIIGLSSNPNTGKSTPAASGTPNAL